MDFIPFEKVSVEEAKAALDKTSSSLLPEKNWSDKRAASPGANTELTEQALKWLDALPKEIQPGRLIQSFPRIINKLAELWPRPINCEQYLDTLILDHRGGRKGFPPDVATEITLLKNHLTRNVGARNFDIWSENIGR